MKDMELGKGLESRQSLGQGKAWEAVSKSLAKGTRLEGLWVAHRQEAGACGVQVSFVSAPGKSVLSGRRGPQPTVVACSFYTPRVCSDSTRLLMASAGESWLPSISWLLLSPKGSSTAASPCCRQTAGHQRTFTSACAGIGHTRVSLSSFHICAQKLHLQLWYRPLREDFTYGRTCAFGNQQQRFQWPLLFYLLHFP